MQGPHGLGVENSLPLEFEGVDYLYDRGRFCPIPKRRRIYNLWRIETDADPHSV